jgi:hypothetical protein
MMAMRAERKINKRLKLNYYSFPDVDTIHEQDPFGNDIIPGMTEAQCLLNNPENIQKRNKVWKNLCIGGGNHRGTKSEKNLHPDKDWRQEWKRLQVENSRLRKQLETAQSDLRNMEKKMNKYQDNKALDCRIGAFPYLAHTTSTKSVGNCTISSQASTVVLGSRSKNAISKRKDTCINHILDEEKPLPYRRVEEKQIHCWDGLVPKRKHIEDVKLLPSQDSSFNPSYTTTSRIAASISSPPSPPSSPPVTKVSRRGKYVHYEKDITQRMSRLNELLSQLSCSNGKPYYEEEHSFGADTVTTSIDSSDRCEV